MSRIGVVGSRDFHDYYCLSRYLSTFKISHIISGGANGADSLAEKYAVEKKIPFTVFPARWEVYGRSAGIVRNKLIVEDSDFIVAFWNGSSPGTRHTINYAKEVGKKVYIVDGEGVMSEL